MTLGAWMKNYLYIPLGGNKVKTKRRLYFNLWLVFLASGLWHGAAWGFVIWGAYHGFFLVVERMGLSKWLSHLGKAAVIYSFVVVVIGWVFFRLEHFQPAMAYLEAMFTWKADSIQWYPTIEFWTVLSVAVFFSFFTLSKVGAVIQEKIFFAEYSLRRHYVVAAILLVLCFLSAAHLALSTYNPFIYFRF